MVNPFVKNEDFPMIEILLLETPDCQQFITHRDNIGCKRIRFSTSKASSSIGQSIVSILFTLLIILI